MSGGVRIQHLSSILHNRFYNMKTIFFALIADQVTFTGLCAFPNYPFMNHELQVNYMSKLFVSGILEQSGKYFQSQSLREPY
jgi:hypothetical protein